MSVTNTHMAKTIRSQLIEATKPGDDVVIARNGVPQVRLAPIAL